MQGHAIEERCWILDPAHSAVEFAVRHFWGAMTVKGRFRLYKGRLDLRSQPSVWLTVEASSLDTGKEKRDRHLRSADFFDCAQHPQLQFLSDSATLIGEQLNVEGSLRCAGASVPVNLQASLRTTDAGLEIEAVTEVDQRELGMRWSPGGMLRAPSRLTVRGRLIDAPASEPGD